MTPDSTCRLIVNADDFGLSDGVNRGIVESHVHGIVTRTSLMVRQPAAHLAAELSRQHPNLSVGLHLDFAEWAYRGGEWVELYRFIDVDDPSEVVRETEQQLELFQQLLHCLPTHLDSHQHVHRRPHLFPEIQAVARGFGIPLRFDGTARYWGDFYGQTAEAEPNAGAISAAALVELIAALPPGLHEFCCHPGYAAELNTMYRDERKLEIRSLCSPSVRQAIVDRQIVLSRFDRKENP